MAGSSRTVACTFCKKRKRKCDGEKPCSICQKYNRNGECEYLADQDKRKFKYDSTFIDYLELKVDLLQQLADGLIRSDPLKAMVIDPELVELRTQHGMINQSSRSSNNNNNNTDNKQSITNTESLLKELANEKAIEELISTKWKVRKDIGGYTEFYGPVSGRQEVIENIEKELDIDTNLNYDEILIENNDLRIELIMLFQKNFGNYFYISQMDDYKQWELPIESISKKFLMFAILTFGSIFKNDQQLTSYLLKNCENLAIKASKANDEFVIEGLLILSCYYLGMGLDSNSWIFDAMTSSMTQYLKLDQQVLDTTNQEGVIPFNKRSTVLFWSVILQDRIITSVLGRGCRLQYFRIKTEFLTNYYNALDEMELNNMNEINLSELTFCYHSKLWFIHDKYLSQIYSFKADHLHNSHRLALMNQGVDNLVEFYSNLPEILKYNDNLTDPRIIILHLSYSVTVLLLHRAYLKQIPLKVIQITSIHCEKAGNLILKLINETELNNNSIESYSNHNIDSPHFISYLILTCATFDLFLMSNKDESFKLKSSKRIEIYIKALNIFGIYWKRCLKDIKVIKELAERWNLNIPILNEDYEIFDIDNITYGIDLNVDEFFHHFNPSPTDSF